MEANYSQEILTYVAERSVEHFQFNEVTRRFQQHSAIISKLYSDYNKTISPGMPSALNTLRQMGEPKEISIQNTIRMLYDNQKHLVGEYSQTQRYIAGLKAWALESYKEIVSFRTFITGGQQLVYDVKGGSHRYRLTEEEYLELLSAGNVTARTQNWDSKSLSRGDLNNILALEITNPASTLRDIQETPVYLKKYKGIEADALYSYLSNNVYSHDFPMSRIYELYDQLRFSMFSDISKDSPIEQEIFDSRINKDIKFANKKIANGLDNFIENYIEAGLHKENDAFYKMGDSVEYKGSGQYTLIENKMVGATVSIRTIKNAINSLHSIVNQSKTKKQMAAKLKEFYTNKESGNTFSDSIQEGARKEAIRGIEQTIKSISAADIKIILNSS